MTLAHREELRLGLLLERRGALALGLERKRGRSAARVVALFVVQRLFAILITAGKNAFPGEAVVHEIENRTRLGFRRAGDEHRCKQRHQAYTESKP